VCGCLTFHVPSRSLKSATAPPSRPPLPRLHRHASGVPCLAGLTFFQADNSTIPLWGGLGTRDFRTATPSRGPLTCGSPDDISTEYRRNGHSFFRPDLGNYP
jgi:hypothetical protein